VHISDSNANVTVSEVKGDLDVDNRFGSVRADAIHGSADVDSSNGSVTLNDVAGNVKIHTSFASAFVKNARGAVDIQNQNGAISVSGLAIACHPITLQTTFSSIKVSVPASGGYDLQAGHRSATSRRTSGDDDHPEHRLGG